MRCKGILNHHTWKLGMLVRRSSSQNKSGGTPQSTRWPLIIRAAAKPGLEVESVDEAGKAGARASTTTVVVTSNISNRGIVSGSDSNSRPPGSSIDIHSHSSGDRGISRRLPDPGPIGSDRLPIRSSTPGPAGRGHLPNSSTVAEGLTRGDDIIGDAISRTGSRFCVSEAEHFPADCRATAPAPVPQHRPYAASSFSGAYAAQYDTCPLPPGHRTTAMDIRLLQATGLRRNRPGTHLPSRCHRCLNRSDRLHKLHLHRRLP